MILLDRVFFSPYTLTGKEKILIKQAVCAGAEDARRFVRRFMSAKATGTGRPFTFGERRRKMDHIRYSEKTHECYRGLGYDKTYNYAYNDDTIRDLFIRKIIVTEIVPLTRHN